MATIQYVSVPFLSLGSSTARLNPKLSTSPIARKINLVGPNQTDNSKRLAKISNHAYNNSEKNQILSIDNLDHKPTIHRISANTQQKVLQQIDLQENRGELCIENQKSEKKPST